MHPEHPNRRFGIGLLLAACALLSGGGPAPAEGPFNLAGARRSVVFIRRLTPGLPPVIGSGFLVSKDGLIYTSRRVVRPDRGASRGTVLLVGVPSPRDPDELDYFRAQEVPAAPGKEEIDFAILRIAAGAGYGGFTPLPTSQERLELGSDAAVLGYPGVFGDRPALTYRKGTVAATRVEFEGKAYYQTEMVVQGGMPGGPLLNPRGEAVGVLSFRDTGLENAGFALQLRDIGEEEKALRARLAEAKPEPGPLDPRKVPAIRGIAPRAANWMVGQGQVREGRGETSLEADGGPYWITSKEALPEDFQVVIRCAVEFWPGSKNVPQTQRSIMRLLTVRFGTEATDKDIMERLGTRVEFSHALMMLSREGQALKRVETGNRDIPFTLCITKQGGTITVAVDDEVVLEYQDDKPFRGRSKLSIGGYLSRLHLGDVAVIDWSPAP